MTRFNDPRRAVIGCLLSLFMAVALAMPAVAKATEAMPADVTAAPAHWSLPEAHDLLAFIDGIGAEGLDPADYHPHRLAEAITAGTGPALDSIAGAAFTAVATDLRDGHTPLSARLGYMMQDKDAQRIPIAPLMQHALASGRIGATLAGLDPTSRGFLALKQALATTPADDAGRRRAIRINMDRWRWLPRDPGEQYLFVNVPEFLLRLVIHNHVLATYRTIVGKPGRTATPQVTALVRGLVFNPTWTAPQSIVVGEGLGRKVLNNPRWARKYGYVATRQPDGSLKVVQQPGPRNALGEVKLDMPNPYAIFLHGTPSKSLFERKVRAFSHGCIRTQNIRELALVLSIIAGGPSVQEAEAMLSSGKYTLAPLARPIPVTVGYFTMGLNPEGKLVSFPDIYKRDPAVLATLN